MRKAFSDGFLKLAQGDSRVLLLSGDLGFMAFEGLVEALGPRFMNTGVAEQTMVSLAAGMAYRDLRPFCYSIAPFMVFRPLEQIRLDVCLHRLPVCLVGNGGGYGYGIMGATHHALEDLACLSCLPHMTCYIPAYDDDVAPALAEMLGSGGPGYLRLGLGPARGTPLAGFPSVQVARAETAPRLTVVALGPMVHTALPAAASLPGVEVFAVTKIPLDDTFELIAHSARTSRRVVVVEEHVARGGLGELVASRLVGLDRFAHRCALGYPDGLYGSQAFHRQTCGLEAASLQRLFEEQSQ